MSLRVSYNRFLDTNQAFNELGSVQSAIRSSARGNAIRLTAALALGGMLSLALSLFASVMGYGNPGLSMLYSLAFSVVNMLVSNVIFGMFLLAARAERMDMGFVRLFGQRLPLQICCGVVLAIAQSLSLSLVLQLTAFDARLNTLASILISITFTVCNAVVAFRIVDGARRFGDIMPGIFRALGRHWLTLAALAILFFAWSFAANSYYASLLYDHIVEIQEINNVLHALLNQHNFDLFGQVLIFHIVNFVIGGFFEGILLLGAAECYDRERENVFG